MPEPIASWRPDLDCWVASDDEAESLFSVPSAVFSETFPTSGMTRSGTAYALLTSEPHMDDSGSFSLPDLLPTPNTHNWKESGHCRDFGADLTHALMCGCRDYQT